MNEEDVYREWAPLPAWRRAVACRWEQRVTADQAHLTREVCALTAVTPALLLKERLGDRPSADRKPRLNGPARPMTGAAPIAVRPAE